MLDSYWERKGGFVPSKCMKVGVYADLLGCRERKGGFVPGKCVKVGSLCGFGVFVDGCTYFREDVCGAVRG